jgi:hypothetical protein
MKKIVWDIRTIKLINSFCIFTLIASILGLGLTIWISLDESIPRLPYHIPLMFIGLGMLFIISICYLIIANKKKKEIIAETANTKQ